MRNKDHTNEWKSQRKENAIEDRWSAKFRNAIIGALEASSTIEGYIMSDLHKLPNLSAPPADRSTDQNFPKFEILASTIAQQLPNIVLQAISPGGVIDFTYPRYESIEGIDMFKEDYYKNIFGVSLNETMYMGIATYNGPWHTQLPSGEKLWTIQICQPVYNATGKEIKGPLVENFWGFVTINLNVSNIIRNSALDENMKAEGMDYLLYSMYQNGTVVKVASSLVNPTNEEISMFIKTSTGNLPFLHSFGFTLAVKTHYLRKFATNGTVTVVISSMLLACVVLFAIMSALIISYTQEYDERMHAPKTPPFAVLTFGPTNGEKLWGSSSDEMDAITKKLKIILDANAKNALAYSIPQLQPYTHSYVFRRVDDAVRMALGVMSELQRRPIDKPMQRLFGEEGQLLLAYAVHWCVDASVRPSPYAGGGYLYEGPDVVNGVRMWIFAVPNVITLSEPAMEALKRTNLFFSTVEHFRRIEVNELNQSLYLMTCMLFDGSSQVAMHRSSGDGLTRKRSRMVAAEEPRPSLELPSCSYYEQSLSPVYATKEDSFRSCTPNLADRTACKRSPQCSSTSNEQGGNLRRSPNKIEILQESERLQQPTNIYDPNAAPKCNELNSCLSSSPLCDGGHIQKHDDTYSTRNIRINVRVNNTNASLSSGSNVQQLPSSLRNQALMITSYENDAVSTLLLHPNIPAWQIAALRAAFEKQAITVKIQFETVKLIIYYFYSCYKLLFRPLASAERINIFRRLVTVFGVPERDILENLAARCVIRYIKNHEESKVLLRTQTHGEKDQQRPLL
ncbi:unnamed protein product [Phytomonas sp. EM1]|nr:unnamed protein product [Phytomonas sp. EM1]|eukprot:CCW62208.1 unnamed protein product [Phytomonas sp. isolate EM1]